MSRCRPTEKSHTRQAGPDIMDFIDLNMHLINPQIEVVQKPQTTGHKHQAKTYFLNELETINYNLPILTTNQTSLSGFFSTTPIRQTGC